MKIFWMLKSLEKKFNGCINLWKIKNCKKRILKSEDVSKEITQI